MRLNWRYTHINRAAGAQVRFFKRVLTNVGSQAGAKLILIHQALASHGAEQPAPLPGFQIVVFRDQHFGDFSICVNTQHSGNDRTNAGTSNNLGKQPLVPERFDNPEVEHPKAGAAAQQERRTPVTG